mmetsp:Transcript_49685/g.144097  ORF Transcript_49685/g.144097 Transcript_49685/m.144097 type:complete len:305 (-) Transcript_49685:65-979(-)
MANANAVTGNVCVFVCATLAILWTITLTRPWTWLWSNNAIVLFKVSLFTIYIDRGTATIGHALELGGRMTDAVFRTKSNTSLKSLFNKNLWMEQGVQELCSVALQATFQWCDTWTMLKYGSAIYVFSGFVTVLFLLVGGSFMYYYAHFHATKTGRLWIKGCFYMAPCSAWSGLLFYTLLTFQHGSGDRQLFVSTQGNYGAAYFLACFLTALTGAPLYLYHRFFRADKFEKQGDDDDFPEQLDDLGYYGATAGHMHYSLVQGQSSMGPAIYSLPGVAGPHLYPATYAGAGNAGPLHGTYGVSAVW